MPIVLTELFNALEKEKTMTLATCAKNRVTIRPMSHISNGREIYFQTSKNSLKMQQIMENPNVAICCVTYEIEGKAVIQGHPLEEPWFMETYRAKHPEAFVRYSNLPDEVIVKVEIHRVRQWQYVNGASLLAEAELTKKAQQELEEI